MQRLFTAASVRELDRAAIAAGLPGIALMESAGAAAAAIIRERFPEHRSAIVACGPGNNGGDGFVVARRLRQDGVDARLCLAAPDERYRGDAATMLGVARACDVPEGTLDSAGLVIDALLGTGSSGAPREQMAAVIAQIARTGAQVVALDVPSGVDSSTGEVAGAAVRADLTICFHGRKIGTAVEPGRSHAGDVVVAAIGLPDAAAAAPDALRYATEDLAALPRRSPTGSKYDAGAVLVAGGAPGTAGAPALAARAAMRAGAGLVWVAVPESERALVAGQGVELMVHGCLADADAVLALAGRADAVVLGPGLGRDDAAAALVERLVAEVEASLLLDADALWALRGRLAVLRGRRRPTVLTPHAGELARLLDVKSADVAEHRLASLRRASDEAGCAVLLKGPDTLVAAPGEPVRVAENDVPALATAGAGDVLAGVVAAILARGVAPAEALTLAAVAHGAAARIASAAFGAIVATDLERPLARLLG